MFRSVLMLASLLSMSATARILGVFMTPSYSHQLVYQPIWRELSLRGHQVTVLTPNPLNEPALTNLTEIDLSFSYETWNNHSIATLGSREHSTATELKQLSKAYIAVSEVQLAHAPVQRLIADTTATFDLVIVEFLWPVMYAFKDRFNCPLVGVTSLGLTVSGYDAIGNPNHPVLNPAFTLPFSADLSFKERVISTAYNVFFTITSRFNILPKLDAIAQKYIGTNVRGLDVIAREVSLIIVNSNLALQNVKPLVPAYVEIAGMHIRPKKPLPDDLDEYLNTAKEGVIYFSLGSNVKSHLLPEEKLKQLMQTFAELPYKVLWKYEDDNLPNKPENVEIRKWLPQQDVLGHPNVKLFITQGGLQSLDESIYNRVPMLAIPFFGDQRYNAHHLVHSGAGLAIDFHSFTKTEFKEKIFEVIRNRRFKRRLNQLSLIAFDQQVPALDKAVWWIEYVLRHDGAAHLRYAATDMPFYQYFLLDVMAFVVTVISFVLYILLRIFKHVVVCYGVVRRVLVSMNIYKREKSHVS